LSALNSIIGVSSEIDYLRELIKTVGPSDSTTLILGDSGTGKELVAKALHDSSNRANAPFVPVNCGAIPKDLLESELFGHKKGAFTGALGDRKGRFQLANGGTLFLDEIGDMSMDLQVKLLRVLQERTVDPVGASNSVSIDVRVVAATHKNIETLIEQGKFREDLFYRLNVMPLEIKALAERKEDIPILFDFFALQHNKEGNQPIRLHTSSMRMFCDYDWPGNVRELSNLVARYTALFPGTEVDLRQVPSSMIPGNMRLSLEQDATDALLLVSAEVMSDSTPKDAHLSPHNDKQQLDIFPEVEILDHVQRVVNLAQGQESFPEEGVKLKEHLLEIECGLIKQALDKANGNVSQTARLLGLQRTTLIEKINKHNLNDTY
jgi:sigma-54 specific flagellar transcriptional regulator A